MDVGERVRLRAPARGHQNVHGEVIECDEARNAALVRWDGLERHVWYMNEDLLPLLP